MGVQLEVSYLGALQCRAHHGPSADVLTTDAPKDNHGQGLHFSPTDLLAASLATCMLTTMGIAARAHTIDMTGASAAVEKHMGTEPRRFVRQVDVSITLPQGLSEHQRTILERAAAGCPVAASLAPQTQVVLRFIYS